MASSETQFIQQTHQRPYTSAALTSVEDGKDSEAADPYDAFIWALARKFTNSPEEAEAAVQEMFIDIRRCEQGGVTDQPIQHRVASLIGLRRLLRFLHLA